jgi:hypothetical protein
MIEAVGDLWTWPADWRVIPTNGVVKASGELVMGAGLAKQAALRYPELPRWMGDVTRRRGAVTAFYDPGRLILLPTKYHWKDPASLSLILLGASWMKQSLSAIVNGAPPPPCRVVLPRLGCGLGGLSWERQVKPVLEKVLDDRFVVLTPR